MAIIKYSVAELHVETKAPAWVKRSAKESEGVETSAADSSDPDLLEDEDLTKDKSE